MLARLLFRGARAVSRSFPAPSPSAYSSSVWGTILSSDFGVHRVFAVPARSISYRSASPRERSGEERRSPGKCCLECWRGVCRRAMKNARDLGARNARRIGPTAKGPRRVFSRGCPRRPACNSSEHRTEGGRWGEKETEKDKGRRTISIIKLNTIASRDRRRRWTGANARFRARGPLEGWTRALALDFSPPSTASGNR